MFTADKRSAVDLAYFDSRHRRLLLRFTNPLKLGRELTVDVRIGDDRLADVQWKPISVGSSQSSVWVSFPDCGLKKMPVH